MNSKCIIVLAFLLNSCANNIYNELGGILSDMFSNKDISQEEINRIPYASLQMKIGRSPFSLIVLEEDLEDSLKWTSSNLIKIYTRHGKIIKFSGIDNELVNLQMDSNNPLLTGNLKDSTDEDLTAFYTFRNPDLFEMPIQSNFKFLSKEEIFYLGKKIMVNKFIEKSYENLIRWNFENLYWINPIDNEVIKSIQNITPKNSKVEYKITRQYKKPD